MLVSPDETKLLIPIPGWIQAQALLRVWDVRTGTAEDHELSEALRIDLIPGDDEYFAVRHRGDDLHRVMAVTIHTFSEPGRPVSRISPNPYTAEAEIEGDREAWHHVPSLIPLDFPLVLAVDEGVARLHRIRAQPAWADEENPPLMTACPDRRTLIISTSRFGGKMLVYDLPSAQQSVVLDLGGGGLHVLRFRDEGSDLWVANHDQIHRIDTGSWSAVDAVRLRNDTSGSFVKDLRFDAAERRCAVSFALRRPRPLEGYPQYPLAVPAGGRVLVFDVDSFKVTHRAGADSPEWIDHVALLSDDRVFGLTRSNEQWRVWQGRVLPTTYPLYAARNPEDRIWM